MWVFSDTSCFSAQVSLIEATFFSKFLRRIQILSCMFMKKNNKNPISNRCDRLIISISSDSIDSKSEGFKIAAITSKESTG